MSDAALPPGHRATVLRLLRFMRPLRGVMAVSVVARTVKLLTQTALIAFAAASVARYAAQPGAGTLWHTVLGLVGLAFVLGLASYLETYTGHYVAFRLLAMLRGELYDRIEPLAPAGTMDLRSGDAVSRVLDDCERIEPFYAHAIAPVITAVVVPAVLLAWLALRVHPLYAWTLLPFVVFMVAVLPVATARLGGRGGEQWRRAQGEVNAFLTDSLQGLRDTIAFGYGERRRRELWALGERLRRGQDRLNRADAVQRGVAELLVAAAVIAMLWVSWRLYRSGAIEPLRDVPVVVAVTLTGFNAALGLLNVVKDYRVAIASAQRLFELMDRKPLVEDRAGRSPPGADGGVEFRDVHFAYPPGGHAVLRGLSFELRPGRHVALVGGSGAGKSTVAQLLLRFWDADRGEVLVGGVPVGRYRLEDLRARVAVVSQRDHLFDTTIGENIRMGRPDASEAELAEAVRRAGLAAWIADLPAGLDTPVGERGTRISGGQRQRIAIARALLRDAPILILDEATSSLDPRTECEVNAAIRELARGRTVLTIAHRLATVRDAEEILVLEQGRIVERGTHEELLRRGGAYARIFALQGDELETLLPAPGV